ncbi:MAG TPA: alpha/beta hydrolase-fold protein [Fimbriimonadaceae bacterium]|nr:alpha/beta hydrolase-fold protein [Fimbriimonadaceae bacterium]
MLAALSVLILSQETRKPSLTGNIVKHPDFESKFLGNKRDIWVYLPPNYRDEQKRKFPILILHDGQNVFDGMTSFIPNKEWRADETAEAMINAGLMEPIIIVAVSNAGVARGDEYLATRGKAGRTEIGGKGDLYGKFLVDEALPFLAKTYRVDTRPEVTGLCGSSLGGLITLHLGLSTKRFGRLGVVSPSVWWNNREVLGEVAKAKLTSRPRIWLDMGGEEGKDGLRDARDLRDVLLKRGWTNKNLRYYEEPGAQHNEDAWARRFDLILGFLYGRS